MAMRFMPSSDIALLRAELNGELTREQVDAIRDGGYYKPEFGGVDDEMLEYGHPTPVYIGICCVRCGAWNGIWGIRAHSCYRCNRCTGCCEDLGCAAEKEALYREMDAKREKRWEAERRYDEG